MELMCGTGRVSLPLLKQGISLTCVDYSAGMLERFREKLIGAKLQACLIEADVCRLDLGRKFNDIFIPFNSFMELVGEQKQMSALTRIHAHLAENGLFICTLHNPALRTLLATGEKVFRGEFQLPDDHILKLHSKEEIDPEHNSIRGIQYYTICNKLGELLVERQLEINFSLITNGQFEYMADRAGFTVEKLYGDYSRGEFDSQKSPFMIYYLRKGD